MLLEKGAEINAQGGVYGNALQAACEGGHKATVRLMIARGAKLFSLIDGGRNSLDAAAQKGDTGVLELILQGVQNTTFFNVEDIPDTYDFLRPTSAKIMNKTTASAQRLMSTYGHALILSARP
ncbi:hypothetical protein MBLNU13_g04123t1 [Cladosporium sp. NU13]